MLFYSILSHRAHGEMCIVCVWVWLMCWHCFNNTQSVSSASMFILSVVSIAKWQHCLRARERVREGETASESGKTTAANKNWVKKAEKQLPKTIQHSIIVIIFEMLDISIEKNSLEMDQHEECVARDGQNTSVHGPFVIIVSRIGFDDTLRLICVYFRILVICLSLSSRPYSISGADRSFALHDIVLHNTIIIQQQPHSSVFLPLRCFISCLFGTILTFRTAQRASIIFVFYSWKRRRKKNCDLLRNNIMEKTLMTMRDWRGEKCENQIFKWKKRKM